MTVLVCMVIVTPLCVLLHIAKSKQTPTQALGVLVVGMTSECGCVCCLTQVCDSHSWCIQSCVVCGWEVDWPQMTGDWCCGWVWIEEMAKEVFGSGNEGMASGSTVSTRWCGWWSGWVLDWVMACGNHSQPSIAQSLLCLWSHNGVSNRHTTNNTKQWPQWTTTKSHNTTITMAFGGVWWIAWQPNTQRQCGYNDGNGKELMKDGKTVVDDERWIVVGHGQGQCVVGDWQGATHMHAC